MDRSKFLYAPVNVPNWSQIHQEMLAWQKKLGTPREWFFHNVENLGALDEMPTLVEWFEEKNLHMAECVYIIVRPRVITNIHSDLFAPNALALNFPVTGCETVRTHFYEELPEVINRKRRDAKRRMMFQGINLGPSRTKPPEPEPPAKPNPHPDYHIDDVRQIGDTCVNVPTMLNVSVLHSVVNTTNRPRIVFSFRFKEEPWHLIEEVDPTLAIGVQGQDPEASNDQAE